MKMSEIYRRAIDILIQRGHTKTLFVDNQGRVCAVGALRLASGARVVKGSLDFPFPMIVGDPDTTKHGSKFQQDHSYLTGPYDSVADFNNHPATTMEDVILHFKEKACEYELRGE